MGYREPYNVSIDECAELFYRNKKFLNSYNFLRSLKKIGKMWMRTYLGLTMDIHMPFHPQIKNKKESNHKRSHKAYKNFHPLQKKCYQTFPVYGISLSFYGRTPKINRPSATKSSHNRRYRIFTCKKIEYLNIQ